MKTYKRVTLSVFVGVVVLSVATGAFGWGEVSKAREFMQAGMYPQAIELLGKRINDTPTDADAHFQLGVCYVHTKNYRGADERFASAVRLNPDYGYKIGGQYQKAGTEKLNKGQMQSAIRLFDQAIKYQPNLKNKIAMQCKTTGLQYLEKNKLEEAVKPLKAAAAYQPQLSEEIAKIFFDKANAMINGTTQNTHSGKSEIEAVIEEANPKSKLKILRIAVNYSKRKQTIQVEKIATTISHQFKEAKIEKASVEKELNEIPTKLSRIIVNFNWPPTWKSRPGYPKTFMGKGYKNSDYIVVATKGKNIYAGDKITVHGPELAFGKRSMKKIKKDSFTVKTSASDGWEIPYRSKDGIRFTVDVKYFE